MHTHTHSTSSIPRLASAFTVMVYSSGVQNRKEMGQNYVPSTIKIIMRNKFVFKVHPKIRHSLDSLDNPMCDIVRDVDVDVF